MFLHLLACAAPTAGTETDVSPAAVCDGELQEDEAGLVDSPFDLDGDGYMTGDEPDCRNFYGSDFVDCDDNDADIHPGRGEIRCNGIDDDCSPYTDDASDFDGDGVTDCEDCDDANELRAPGFEEVCWDGIDNDCDAVIDEDCGTNWAGDWDIDVPVVYTCSLGIIDMNFSAVTILYNPPFFTVANATGGGPGAMEGEVVPFQMEFQAGVFKTVGTFASCDELYVITGTFTDDDHFTATFDAYYEGLCLNCSFQTWSFNGTRATVATR
jgi:hypothetical protein